MSPFLAWGDFHARSRFARSTILEEEWGTTRSLFWFLLCHFDFELVAFDFSNNNFDFQSLSRLISNEFDAFDFQSLSRLISLITLLISKISRV